MGNLFCFDFYCACDAPAKAARKGVATCAQAPCRGDRPRLTRSQAATRLRQRLTARGSCPWAWLPLASIGNAHRGTVDMHGARPPIGDAARGQRRLSLGCPRATLPPTVWR
ncbi:hypothetical protein BHE74_00056485 [Ensete ventricosum]|nr:hypothetical protein GW17_00060597 [Ensete ventricosum]RWW38298.1 hypothetical protein BHE74_00056485 [Ensete ventricosum]RZS06480.1 hypothetical protein BHM03_00037138 [Ensete ventricosum]